MFIGKLELQYESYNSLYIYIYLCLSIIYIYIDYQEQKEIELPGKKVEEFIQLLNCIYPPIEDISGKYYCES